MKRPSDKELAELLMLQAQIKDMEKRISEIKLACKRCGSFFTGKYTVSIITRTRVGLAGLEEVKEYIDEEVLNQYNLIRESEYQIVEVGILPEMPVLKHYRKPISN